MKPGLTREYRTVETMIEMYCRKYHRPDGLCSECRELAGYARARLEKCPFGENKPVCSKCPVHCYTPVMREKIRQVMRYAGPRMVYTHPLLALRHFIHKKKNPPVRESGSHASG
jgi:hypothetical protein